METTPELKEEFEKFVAIFEELVPEASGGKAERTVWEVRFGVSLEVRHSSCPFHRDELCLVVHRDGREYGYEEMWGQGSDAWEPLEQAARRTARYARAWLKGPQTAAEKLAHKSYLNRRARRAASANA